MINNFPVRVVVTILASFFISLSDETTIQNANSPLEVPAADDSTSKIKGPLVSVEAGSFADTLMVLLQSRYYNNNGFPINKQNASATVLGVRLHVRYEGFLTLLSTQVQKDSIEVNLDGRQIQLTINIPMMLVNKTYFASTAENPDYESTGYVLVTVDGVTLHTIMDIAQVPYFVGGLTVRSQGPSNSTIHGEGILLAEEIQEAIQDFAVMMFSTMDLWSLFDDLNSKMVDIFNRNQLLICLSCEQSYCECYD